MLHPVLSIRGPPELKYLTPHGSPRRNPELTHESIIVSGSYGCLAETELSVQDEVPGRLPRPLAGLSRLRGSRRSCCSSHTRARQSRLSTQRYISLLGSMGTFLKASSLALDPFMNTAQGSETLRYIEFYWLGTTAWDFHCDRRAADRALLLRSSECRDPRHAPS